MRDEPSKRPPEVPARIALLMILGEYALDRRESVWQETLVGGLAALGYSAHAARQATARATRSGLLEAERHGRRALMRPTPRAIELLRDGQQRLFTFGQSWDWDGSWLLVTVRVPESRRNARNRLRNRLGWAGFGSLGNGLWLTPHVDRQAELAEALAEEQDAEAWSFHARQGELGDLDRLVRLAWDIDGMVASYESFIAEIQGMRPRSPEEMFVSLISMLVTWRAFPFVDPDLPPELLPKGWLRERAYRLFHDRRADWLEPARTFVGSLEPFDAEPAVAAASVASA